MSKLCVLATCHTFNLSVPDMFLCASGSSHVSLFTCQRAEHVRFKPSTGAAEQTEDGQKQGKPLTPKGRQKTSKLEPPSSKQQRTHMEALPKQQVWDSNHSKTTSKQILIKLSKTGAKASKTKPKQQNSCESNQKQAKASESRRKQVKASKSQQKQAKASKHRQIAVKGRQSKQV